MTLITKYTVLDAFLWKKMIFIFSTLNSPHGLDGHQDRIHKKSYGVWISCVVYTEIRLQAG